MINTGIILGSGLHKLSENLENSRLIFEDLRGIHVKRVLEGFLFNKKVILFEGRNHIYENPSNPGIYFAVNKAVELGLKHLVVTNAAGGLNSNFRVADLMLISSHINFYSKFLQTKGYEVNYDREYIHRLTLLALKKNIKLHTGTYLASPGPFYETMKEIKLFKKIGADSVGMSTIPELYTSSKNKIKITGISCITNILHPYIKGEISHLEVLEAGKKAFQNLSQIIKIILSQYDN